MARTRVKICGISTIDTALAAAQAGADAIGLVFVERSPRQVDVQTARAIVDALPPLIEPIGLFVDMPAQGVSEIAERVRLRTVQLHGHETSEYTGALTRRDPPLHIIKALPFEAAHAEARLAPWRDAEVKIAGILWDAPPPPAPDVPFEDSNGRLPGGSGQRLDWGALARHGGDATQNRPPIILAGGLTPGNVDQAIRVVRPFAVDVSSGVESARGVKDPARIAAFCAAVRRTDARLSP